MPNAFRNGGLGFGIVGTIVVGLICTHCVQMLVYCSQILSGSIKKPSLGFSETAEVAFQTGPQKYKQWSTIASYNYFSRKTIKMKQEEYSLESLQILIKSCLESNEAEKTKLEEEIIVLNSKINRLQCELESANSSTTKIENELKVLQDELDSQQKLNVTKVEDLKKTQIKLSCAEKELENLKEVIDNLNSKGHEKIHNEKLLHHLEDVIRENENVLRMKNDIIRKNEADIEELKKEIEKWKLKYEELASNISEKKGKQERLSQTDETREDLSNAEKMFKDKERQLSQNLESLSQKEAIIKKLKEENQSLRKQFQELASRPDGKKIEKRLLEVHDNLNALKTVLQQMKSSKELESSLLQEEMTSSLGTLRKAYLQMEEVLSKRNQNLEEIIDNLSKSLNQSSANLLDIQKEISNTQNVEIKYTTDDNLYSSDSKTSPYITSPSEDPKDVYPYYIGPKRSFSSDTSLTNPEVIRLKRENEMLKNQIKKCTCSKPFILPKKSRRKRSSPEIANLNKQSLDLLDKINSILNHLNHLENFILDFHREIKEFCKCNEFTNEGKSKFAQIEKMMSEINDMIIDTENDFRILENSSGPILMNINTNADILSIKQSSDVVQLQSSLLLLSEHLKEAKLRQNCVKTDFELVKRECDDLINICKDFDLSTSSDNNNRRKKKVLKYLPPNVRIYYPKDRNENNTFLMYVPDENGINNPTPSNLHQLQVLRFSVETIDSEGVGSSNRLDERSVGDAPSRKWKPEYPAVGYNEGGGKQKLKDDYDNSSNLTGVPKSLMEVNTSTSEVKLDNAETSPRISQTFSFTKIQAEVPLIDKFTHTNRSILAYGDEGGLTLNYKHMAFTPQFNTPSHSSAKSGNNLIKMPKSKKK